MSEPAILNAKGIFRGQIEKGVQYYHVTGEDADGDQVVLIFGCRPNFTAAIDTAFSRLFPVIFKAPNTVKLVTDNIIDLPVKGETIQ